MTEHTYPPAYGPDHASPFVRVAWALLDNIKPEAMKAETRFLIAGMIAGATESAYGVGKEHHSPEAFAINHGVGKI